VARLKVFELRMTVEQLDSATEKTKPAIAKAAVRHTTAPHSTHPRLRLGAGVGGCQPVIESLARTG
jgi:hypothetical protein